MAFYVGTDEWYVVQQILGRTALYVFKLRQLLRLLFYQSCGRLLLSNLWIYSLNSIQHFLILIKQKNAHIVLDCMYGYGCKYLQTYVVTINSRPNRFVQVQTYSNSVVFQLVQFLSSQPSNLTSTWKSLKLQILFKRVSNY